MTEYIIKVAPDITCSIKETQTESASIISWHVFLSIRGGMKALIILQGALPKIWASRIVLQMYRWQAQ